MNLLPFFCFVSPLVDAPLFPGSRPETTSYPVLTYKQISDVPDVLLTGEWAGTSTARLQIDVYTEDHSDTNTIAQSVIQALCGYSGPLVLSLATLTLAQLAALTTEQLAGLTIAGSSIQVIYIRLLDDLENPENASDSGDTWVYQRSLDFQIRYKI